MLTTAYAPENVHTYRGSPRIEIPEPTPEPENPHAYVYRESEQSERRGEESVTIPVWLFALSVSPEARLVALIAWSHPGCRTVVALAERTGLSVLRTRRALLLLSDAGLAVQRQWHAEHGRGRHVDWVFDFPNHYPQSLHSHSDHFSISTKWSSPSGHHQGETTSRFSPSGHHQGETTSRFSPSGHHQGETTEWSSEHGREDALPTVRENGADQGFPGRWGHDREPASLPVDKAGSPAGSTVSRASRAGTRAYAHTRARVSGNYSSYWDSVCKEVVVGIPYPPPCPSRPPSPVSFHTKSWSTTPAFGIGGVEGNLFYPAVDPQQQAPTPPGQVEEPSQAEEPSSGREPGTRRSWGAFFSANGKASPVAESHGASPNGEDEPGWSASPSLAEPGKHPDEPEKALSGPESPAEPSGGPDPRQSRSEVHTDAGGDETGPSWPDPLASAETKKSPAKLNREAHDADLAGVEGIVETYEAKKAAGKPLSRTEKVDVAWATYLLYRSKIGNYRKTRAAFRQWFADLVEHQEVDLDVLTAELGEWLTDPKVYKKESVTAATAFFGAALVDGEAPAVRGSRSSSSNADVRQKSIVDGTATRINNLDSQSEEAWREIIAKKIERYKSEGRDTTELEEVLR